MKNTLNSETAVSVYDLNGYYEKTLPLRELAHKFGIKEETLVIKLHQPSAKVRQGYLVSLTKAPKIASYAKSHQYPIYAVKKGILAQKVHDRSELLQLGVTEYNLGNIFLRSLNNPHNEESQYSWTNYVPGTNQFKEFCNINAQHRKHAVQKHRSDIGKQVADGGTVYVMRPSKEPEVLGNYMDSSELGKLLRLPASRLEHSLDSKLPAQVQTLLIVPNGVSVATAMVKRTIIKRI